MTPRPHSQDEAVRGKAAEMALPLVADWQCLDFDRETTLVQLTQALTAAPDGYSICRYLETTYGWSPDAELVDILDTEYLWEAEQEAIAEWVENNHELQPTFNVGDQVAFNWRGGTWTAGIITKVVYEMAYYMVKMDHLQTYAMVHWENAHLVTRKDSASAESGETHLDTTDAIGK